MTQPMIQLDGSLGEGGGQILRTALSLSMVTGQAFRIEKIRAGREKPGLLRQHLTAVNAAAQICGATVEGAAISSRELTFSPGPVKAGQYTFTVGSAGSTTLRREGIVSFSSRLNESTLARPGEELMEENKPFCISKWAVHEAWTKVRSNKGAAGVDDESIGQFEKKLKNNLYRIWNRMSSGSYMPPPVKRVMIPKADGKQRPLGIPTVGDRVAQMVVKMELEPKVEALFHPDSYSYRPAKSALDAVGTCRERCWRYDWVVDLDIRGFFDNIDHALMMHAVRKHTDCPWVLLYIERWLKAPAELEDGTLLARDKGTPQGGVISPLLANIFLHHVFDAWMDREYPGCPFERYADDVVIHCSSYEQALAVKAAVGARLRRCKLEMHPDKTQIVYCRDGTRRQDYPHIQFDFLSYTFRPRGAKGRKGVIFTGFLPAISMKAARAVVMEIREWELHRKSDKELADLSRLFNPSIRGWIAYYGRFYPSALQRIFKPLDRRLVRWAQGKYKRLRSSRYQAWQWLRRLAASEPALFGHWHAGLAP